MSHWCEYKDFAESLKWLADQDNRQIEEFLCAQARRESSPASLDAISSRAGPGRAGWHPRPSAARRKP